MWIYSYMYLQIKYKDTSAPNNILTKPSETKKKVQKREVQSRPEDCLSKQNTKTKKKRWTDLPIYTLKISAKNFAISL